MVQPSTLVRAASVVSALYCAGHMSGIPWTPATGPVEQAVVAQMHAVTFAVEGVQRSYWDFYYGFGLISGAFLALQAVVLWTAAPLFRQHRRAVTPLLVAIAGGFVVNAILAGRFFFALPCALAVATAALVLAAVALARAREARAELPAAATS